MRFIFAIFTLLLVQRATCGNVLFVAPTLFDTQWLYQSLWKGLSLRQHKVTAITADPLHDDELTNLTEIDVSYLNIKLQKRFDRLKQTSRKANIFDQTQVQNEFAALVSEEVFRHSKVQRFLGQRNSFDTCVIDLTYPSMLAFGKLFNCVVVGIYSSNDNHFVESTFGKSAPAFFSFINEHLQRNASLTERLETIFEYLYSRLYFYPKTLQTQASIARKYLRQDVDFEMISDNISLVLSNVHPLLDKNNPTLPAVRKIGGSKKKEYDFLPTGMMVHLKYTETGIIYFTFETIKNTDLPKATINLLIEAFSHLPYDVVWPWEKAELPTHPTNLYVPDWIPRYELLTKPQVKLFITQGTAQAVEDAILNAVPIIGLPINPEDELVISKCVEKGIGRSLDLKSLTAESLRETILDVMANPRYKENAIKLQNLTYDKPRDSLDDAIWWIEYAMRHKGGKTYKTGEINWFNYLLLDVIIFVTAVLLTIVYLFWKFVKCIVCWLCKKRPVHKKKTH